MRLCHLVGSPTRTHCRLTCFEHLFVSVDLFQVPPFKSKHNLLVPVHFRPRRSGSQPTGGHFGNRALIKSQGAIRRSRASWPFYVQGRAFAYIVSRSQTLSSIAQHRRGKGLVAHRYISMVARSRERTRLFPLYVDRVILPLVIYRNLNPKVSWLAYGATTKLQS